MEERIHGPRPRRGGETLKTVVFGMALLVALLFATWNLSDRLNYDRGRRDCRSDLADTVEDTNARVRKIQEGVCDCVLPY